MVRILLIEDEERIQSFLRRKLEAEGYVVDAAGDGARGLARALSAPYDLVVLDLLLPRLDGFSLLRELSEERPGLPVLILSGRGDLPTRLRGFELGARDFLEKPCSLQELLARVRVHVRAGASESGRIVRAGKLVLDMDRREVALDNVVAVLSDREFRLLHALVAHAGEVVSRETLLASVWGYDFDPGSNVVDVCIRRLRKKLGPHAPIETVHHAGYRVAAA